MSMTCVAQGDGSQAVRHLPGVGAEDRAIDRGEMRVEGEAGVRQHMLLEHVVGREQHGREHRRHQE